MGTIVRYENVAINNVTNGVNSVGDQTTTETVWFTSRALTNDVNNILRVSERYRVYSDIVSLTFNYTPNMKEIVDNQDAYSFTWRNRHWRISDCRESNDRMKITFICYRNDPSVPV